MQEDERDGAGRLDDPGAHEQVAGVAGVHEAAGRAGHQQERDHARGEQQADFVGPGAVTLQPEGEGDQGHLVAEGRCHPAGQGHDQVPAPRANV